MSRFRFLLHPGLTSFAFFALLFPITQAEQVPATKAAPPATPAKTTAPAPPPAAKENPKAKEVLDKAIDLLDPFKTGWTEAEIWQKAETFGVTFTSTGEYVSGPGFRLRADLRVHIGNSDGRLLSVSDGTTVWNEMQIGKSPPEITKYNLRQVQEILNQQTTRPQIADEFYRSKSFQGVQPLLRTLKQQLTLTKHEMAQHSGIDVNKLTGEWKAEVAKILSPPHLPWQPSTPRICVLLLDKNAPHWPHRIEWWGPTAVRGEDKLLLAMEFRNPRFYKADGPRPEHLASKFVYNPGKHEVKDVTELEKDRIIRMRSRPVGPAVGGGAPGGSLPK